MMRLFKDLDGVLARNESFARACEIRHHAVSGTVFGGICENPSFPRIWQLVAGLKEWARNEHHLDV
jgi:hypothetical protein